MSLVVVRKLLARCPSEALRERGPRRSAAKGSVGGERVWRVGVEKLQTRLKKMSWRRKRRVMSCINSTTGSFVVGNEC
jgi:hypothetical protein